MVENFSCKKCGACCSAYSHVRVTDDDRIRWENRNDILSSLVEYNGVYFLKIKEHKTCQWLINNECSINDIKPDRCRMWPDNLKKLSEVKKCMGLEGN